MVKSNWDKKVGEKDYVRLAIIVGVLVLAYFVYANFIPKNFDSAMKVDVIEITADCADCANLSMASLSLAERGIEIDDYDVYAYDSDKGRKMMEKYGIEKVPASIVVSKRVSELDLDGIFDVRDDYAVFDLVVPYLDVESGEVRGVVDMIEIVPECEECFSLMPLKTQFERMAVNVDNYEIVGAESAKGLGLINDYELTFAPAVLISKNIDEYGWVMPNIEKLLEDKGDYYLFNAPVAPYKDLIAGEVKGVVDVVSVVDFSCEECFDIEELKQSFLSMGVYFGEEKTLDVSSSEGKRFVKKYNITAVPTVVLSKAILDYPQLKDILFGVGTFDEEDQSFVFRKLEALGEFVEVDL